ncbi:hypothetical protein [Specibacter sp. NPDC078692]|uniref:hypothetical protein n=1 Tax=Specibacter sp. NPDC078692 TaxID=3155818 RepID=UPI0034129144
MDFLSLVVGPVIAAVLVLIGNAAFFRVQTTAKVKEELRAFVRELHPTTVDWVVDLDLLLRELRSRSVSGESSDTQTNFSQKVESSWEGDLVGRTRKIRYGHPDPDVRTAAEDFENAFIPLVVSARTTDDQRRSSGWALLTAQEYQDLLDPAEIALEQLRATVYEAPRRDVPKNSYDGSTGPSRSARERLRAKLDTANNTE